MSAVPLGSSRPSSLGQRNAARYPGALVHQGISAELVAARWKLDRDQLDAYSAESHRWAAATVATGGFAGEMVSAPEQSGPVSADETARAGTTAVTLPRHPLGSTGDQAWSARQK